jgi:hypothetical protein
MASAQCDTPLICFVHHVKVLQTTAPLASYSVMLESSYEYTKLVLQCLDLWRKSYKMSNNFVKEKSTKSKLSL